MEQQRGLCRCQRRTPRSCGIRFKIVASLHSLRAAQIRLTRDTADDFNAYNRINRILLNPASPLKHIPLRVYVPSSPTTPAELGSFKIIQSLLPPVTANREVQTLGSALHAMIPSLFPSRRDPILAAPVLHGAKVPFSAPLEDIMREAAYADGWIHLSVSLIDA